MTSRDTAQQFSRRIGRLQPSPIREILSVIDRPGMVSFAGGLPAPETFPAFDASPMPARWLQYGPSEGNLALRAELARRLTELGRPCDPEQILVLSGSQQGIDLVAKLLIDEGSVVALESPTYLAALQVFRCFGAEFRILSRQAPATVLGGTPRPALTYVIPTFQNPTGHCYDAAERQALARACDDASVMLFEDDPYRDLAYDACERTPVCAALRRASWIYQSSFSKSLAPGLRLGFLAASSDLVPYLTRLKQAADLHSSGVAQWYVLEHLAAPDGCARIERLADTYRRKRDTFGRSLERHFGDLARWARPAGGLFFWLELTRRIDTRPLLAKAVERGVAFMPGEFFFPDTDAGRGTLRLNFSHAGADEVERGLATLAALVRDSATQ